MKFVAVLLLCSFILSHALQWDDCGTPLTRWVSYESVTISAASSIAISQQISINVVAVVSQSIVPLDAIDTQLIVLKDGSVFMNVTTRDLCDILGANNQSCILTEGEKFSYTYQLDFPSIPRGNYSVRIVSTNSNLQQDVGCLELQAAVEGLKDSVNPCTYTSTFGASITGVLDFAQNKFNQTVGDFIQVGPWGRNAGTSRKSLAWGRFTSISGSVDVVGPNAVDAVNYVWGINGTLMNITSEGASAQATHSYAGTVVIGYLLNGTLSGPIEFVYGGNFVFNFLSDPSAGTYGLLSTSRLAMSSKYYHPLGFPYPLVVGNLNPLTLAPTTNGFATTLTASRVWCTCGTSCTEGSGLGLLTSQTANGSKSNGLSLLEDGAIAVGVVGGIAIILAVIFFVVHHKTSRRPVFDPAEMVYPAKPDYGSMALGEIIDEEVPDRV